MARKRQAPKPNGEEAESQKPARSTKKSKNKPIEEEDFVLQISDAEENDEEAIVSNDEQEAVEMNIARVPKRLDTEEQSVFIGKPVDVAEAKRRWPDRYLSEVLFLCIYLVSLFLFKCHFRYLVSPFLFNCRYR